MKGALLDWARSQDYLTRTVRRDLKHIQAAQEAGARTEAELAAATGLTAAKAREVQAAEAVKPVSLDEQELLSGGQYAGRGHRRSRGHRVRGCRQPDTGRAGGRVDRLDAETAVVLALWYHGELGPAVIAKELRTSEARVRSCTMRASWRFTRP